MNFLLLAYLFGAPQSVVDNPTPQSVVIHATYNQAVKSGSFLIWVGDVPHLTIPSELGDKVSISGPWSDGRHVVYYANLSRSTRIEVQALLEKARETWEAEKGEGQVKALRPIPFLRGARPTTAQPDDDLERRGPWPQSLPFIDGMKRFKRALLTQSIAVVNDRDSIERVSRFDGIEAKWHQSGGMLETQGVRSDVYKNEVAVAKEWIGDIGVVNSLGFTQQNRGWKREYPDGSRFLDVLSIDGDVFEIREREKLEGKWRSGILFEDEHKRPKGYTGLNVSCNSCHRQAGSGAYAAGLIPGGDGVISDPIRALEK